MLQALKKFSIKNKLIGLISFIVLLALTSEFIIDYISEVKLLKIERERTSKIIVQMVGEYIKSDLMNNDRESALNTLSKLAVNHEVRNCIVYDSEGKVFAAYHQPGYEIKPPDIQDKNYQYYDEFLQIYYPLLVENKNYGSIVLRVTSFEESEVIRNHLFSDMAVLIMIYVFSLWIIFQLQNVITGPIINLSNIIRKIIKTGDYSIRGVPASEDEVGELTEGLNNMLDQIQTEQEKREKAIRDLQESEIRFKVLAEESPNMIVVNIRNSIVYANKICEEITGYPRNELYKNNFRFDRLIASEYRDLIKENIGKELKGKHVETHEVEIISKTGKRVVTLIASRRISYMGKKAILQILTDITGRKRNEEKAIRLMEQQVAINELSLALGESKGIDNIYKVAFTHIQRFMAVDAFIISLFSRENKMICAAFVVAENKFLDVKQFPPIPLEKPGRGPQSDVIRTGKAVYISNWDKALDSAEHSYEIVDDGRVLKQVPKKDDPDRARSAILVPMKIRDQVIGVIQVQSIRYDDYSQEDIDLLSGIANVAAIAIHNIRLLEKVRQELEIRRKAEKSLRESEKKYRSMIEAAPDGIMTINLKGFITSCNPALLEIGGYEKREILDRHFTRLPGIDLNEIPGLLLRYAIFINGELPAPFELGWQRNNGDTMYAEIHTSALRTNNRLTAIQVVIRDITERKITEQKLKKYWKDVEQEVKYRTNELESFTFSVSHDLKSPLRAINGYTTIYMEKFGKDLSEEEKKILEKVIVNSRQMARLIDDLLDVLKMGKTPLHSGYQNMSALVQQVIHRLSSQIENRNIEWKIHNLPPAVCDGRLILQVWENLIGNAIKYSQNKRTAIIEIGGEDNENEIMYFVRDNGIGFDMKYYDRLFGIFQRLVRKEDFEGTGVGLAIVKRIIDKHKGKVRAKSVPGEGSTFYFTLPVKSEFEKQNPTLS